MEVTENIILAFLECFPNFDEDELRAAFPQINKVRRAFFKCEFGQNDHDDTQILFLLAFLFTQQQNGNTKSSRSTSSNSVGSVSVSFVQSADNDRLTVWLNTNRFGQIFLQLSAKNAVGGFFV